MNKVISSVVVLMMGIAMTGNVSAFEGGTKLIATMNLPEGGGHQPQSALSPSSYDFGSKLIVRFLHRIPEPTLATERIREEVSGPSLGTKPIVLFQKK